MLIQDMTREMSEDLLKHTHVGRPAASNRRHADRIEVSLTPNQQPLISGGSKTSIQPRGGLPTSGGPLIAAPVQC